MQRHPLRIKRSLQISVCHPVILRGATVICIMNAPLAEELQSGWQSTRRVTMGEKECRFLYQLCRRGHNKRTMQWVRLRHGMAWHGRRDKGFFAVHLPCRLASTFIPVWPPLTLVAVNLWLAPSKALILGLLLKGFKDHSVVYLKCKDS